MKTIVTKAVLYILIIGGISRPVFSQDLLKDSFYKKQKRTVRPEEEKPAEIKDRAGFHPYKISIGWSVGISVVGTIGDYLAIPRILGKKTITDAELAALNPDVLTRFDRWALKMDPDKRVAYDHLSDKVITGIFVLPAFLALNRNIRHDGLRLLLMYYVSQAITFSVFNYSFLGPSFQNKFRPMAYYTNIPTGERANGNNRNSFFAGHVSSATAASFFMAKVYCDYHPEIGIKKYLLYAAALIPAAGMGYLRILALKHFPSDVLTGMTIGAVCGVAIPSLYHVHSRNVNVGVFASPDGAAGLSMNWKL